MRNNTERPEAASAGTVKLVVTDEERIFDQILELSDDPEYFGSMARAVNLYGDGYAAVRTVAAVEEMLQVGVRLPEFRGNLIQV